MVETLKTLRGFVCYHILVTFNAPLYFGGRINPLLQYCADWIYDWPDARAPGKEGE